MRSRAWMFCSARSSVFEPPWLSKRGARVKSWKKRYFTLHGTQLSYFTRQDGSLLRTGKVGHAAVAHGKPLCLELTLQEDGRKLLVAADDAPAFAQWQQVLARALLERRQHVLRHRGAIVGRLVHVPPPRVPPPSLADGMASLRVRDDNQSHVRHASSMNYGPDNEGPDDEYEYEGWLEKEGTRFKTWKRRYFTLQRGALVYYAAQDARDALGHGTVTRVAQDPTKPRTLEVELNHARSMRVSADTQQHLDDWFRALRGAAKLLGRQSISH